jgi:tRNA U34 5-methylaminomethyl-2-thiouridine-forming methyltransferase MnmC
MATPQDADLIIKLYELRRDETMRKARNYFAFEFFPKSVDDVKEVLTNVQEYPEQNAYFRQVISYWEMAAAMVNHGSIDRALFFDTNGEFFGVWAKIGDFIEDLRASFGPQFLINLEKMIASAPDGPKRIQILKERFNSMAAQRARK